MITREIAEATHPTKPLGEVATFLDHKRRPVKQSERKEGLFPYYGANGLQGTIDSFIFDEPLILLAEDGGHFDDPDRGIAYEISGKTWVNNHAHVLKPQNGNLDLTYLRRVLENYDVRPFINGSTRSKLTKAQAERIPIPLPPLREQRRIAAILDKADAVRRKRKRALDLFDSLGQSIFLEMFGSLSSNFHRWVTANITDACELIVDCVNRTAPVVDYTTPYKMLRTTNVRNGRVDVDNVRFVTKETFDRWNRRTIPRRGDVLLTREAPVGGVGMLATNDQVFLGQRLMLYRPKQDIMTSEFLVWLFSDKYLRDQFDRMGSGSTVKHLPLPACRAFEVRLPPIALQELFSERISLLKTTEFSSVNHDLQISKLFSSLQSRAFSGQL
jgi:type I restriction enzyme S subunit